MRSARLLLEVVACSALAASAAACDIPVFRYAMAYWEADDYEIAVFHRGGLTAEASEAVALIEARAERSNVKFELIDLAAEGGASAAKPTDASAPLPWMEVRFPLARGSGAPIWAGPPASEAVEAWTESPAREAITTGLLEGAAAVWVFLRSGDGRADADAEATLRSELSRLERVLLIPGAAAPGDVRFAIVPLDRGDAREQALVRMLMMTEPDLSDMADKPMAFPVYGRGRVLHALIGAGINEYTIADAADFVVGPCSCQVKALNPGTDMLIAVDWASAVDPSEWAVEPDLGGIAGFTSRIEEVERLLAEPVAPAVPVEAEAPQSLSPAWLLMLAAGAGAFAVASILRLLRGRRTR